MVFNIAKWLNTSNRWKHLLGGFAIGALCLHAWDAAVSSVAVAGACEWKDKSWHGVWDWCDFGCTVCGGVFGFAAKWMIL